MQEVFFGDILKWVKLNFARHGYMVHIMAIFGEIDGELCPVLNDYVNGLLCLCFFEF